MVKNSHYYGNLQAYKFFIRPDALNTYKTAKDKNLTKHQKTIQKLLRDIALNDPMSTWELAAKDHKKDLDKIRTKEKEFRRLFLGRVDNGRYSKGLLESGLIEREEGVYKNRQVTKYRLSPHGILFCIDTLELNVKEFDKLATKYANIIPKVFGMWSYLKKIIGNDVYKIRILARGMMLDNPSFAQLNPPLYELMSFLTIRYRSNFDYIQEKDLVEQISYWFYIYFTYSIEKKEKGIKNLKKIFRKDKEFEKWFLDFVILSKQYYLKRTDNLTVFLNNFN